MAIRGPVGLIGKPDNCTDYSCLEINGIAVYIHDRIIDEVTQINRWIRVSMGSYGHQIVKLEKHEDEI